MELDLIKIIKNYKVLLFPILYSMRKNFSKSKKMVNNYSAHKMTEKSLSIINWVELYLS